MTIPEVTNIIQILLSIDQKYWDLKKVAPKVIKIVSSTTSQDLGYINYCR